MVSFRKRRLASSLKSMVKELKGKLVLGDTLYY